LTLANSKHKSKETFTYLKDYKKLTAVVELVLNGSRFKLRINE